MRASQQVLIVDDSEMIHRLLSARLNDQDLVIHSAFDGTSGLQMARDLLPDLVLLDIDMPDLTGFEVCRQLKHDSETYNIPIIFLTALEETTNKVTGFDLGAADYITKPFEPAELRARVRAALKTKSLMDLLTSQAQLDGLTGLHNRRYFDQRLAEELDAARRYDRGLGLLMLDIDHFKSVNDSFGHPTGDRVLKALADLLQHVCRASDVTCRYGGEEFGVILQECDREAAETSAGRVLKTVRSSPELVQLLGCPLTVSIGVLAIEAQHRLTPGAAIAKADEALYRAKSEGRNRYHLADAAPRSMLDDLDEADAA